MSCHYDGGDSIILKCTAPFFQYGKVIDAGSFFQYGNMIDAGSFFLYRNMIDAGSFFQYGSMIDAGSFFQYGNVIDAGSSHTSFFLYRWPADKANGTGIVSQVTECLPEGKCTLCHVFKRL